MALTARSEHVNRAFPPVIFIGAVFYTLLDYYLNQSFFSAIQDERDQWSG